MFERLNQMANTCSRAHELDVVRLTEEVGGWPKGTEGTVVKEHRHDLLVEIGDEEEGDPALIAVNRGKTAIVWQFRGASG